MFKLSAKALKGYMPKNAAKALTKVVKRTRRMQRKYLSRFMTSQDADDSAAEVILECVKFIYKIVEENKTPLGWDEETWLVSLRKLSKGILVEYTKNILFPLPLPRPLRFSLKKYSDVLHILNKYELNLRPVIFNSECPVINCHEPCRLGYPRCLILHLSPSDHRRLYDLTRGEKQSLTNYAQMSRKTFDEWIKILEEVSMFSTQTITPDMAMVINYDLESELDLSDLRRRFSKVNPQLYEMFCECLEEQEFQVADGMINLEMPRGWSGRDLKDRYGLSTEQVKELLGEASSIINHLRSSNGLPNIQGGIHTKSFKQ
jgi:hypothetical protein